jgi:hypothetical protein
MVVMVVNVGAYGTEHDASDPPQLHLQVQVFPVTQDITAPVLVPLVHDP